MNKYTPIIGLEVHVELKTESKMFCRCEASYFGAEPNTHVCPVCLGLPGALPVPNKKAIEWCIKIALALNCKINEFSKFDRKNYFYPDLPKGYQISRYDLPFGYDGYIELANKKKVRIRRVHMEEDTGKLSHQDIGGDRVSLIDFNRSSVPLVEIVTEPDFQDALEVKEYLQKLQQIVRYLDVANADMEKGEMRLEPNISLTTLSGIDFVQQPDKLPKYKVEVKNINSFKFVEKAVNYEVKRQQQLLDKNEIPVQETRGWDDNRQKTFSQRVKEEAHDYRYFPEPDIPPIITTKAQISSLVKSLPELPDNKMTRFVADYAVTAYDAELLTREKTLADYFEEAVKVGAKHAITPKVIANNIINKKVDIEKILPAQLIRDIVESKKVVQLDETLLNKTLDEVIAENEKAVTDYKSGKENVIMFLVGQTMKKLQTKADAQFIKNKLAERLST